jgi:hypothetical protein
MTTALSLTSQSTIVNGAGLSTSANLLTQISTFQTHSPIVTMANTYAVAALSNDAPILFGSLSNIGIGVSRGQWLLDLYPSNISPVCSGTISYYAIEQVPIYGTGTHANDIIGYTPSPLVSSASMSGTIKNQAQLPFANGMSGFANVFLNVYSSVVSNFETVASVFMLKNKTYGQSGLGYTNALGLATNGITTNGPLVGNVISTWGTMYDIANINSLGDPYIFGQNLLNQGLGAYGGLADQLTAAGLDITNLSQIPPGTTITTQQASTFSTSSSVGQIELPSITNITTTTSSTGSSEDVVMNIYASITGANLNAIVNATQITASNVSITSLADYLNFNKVVDVTSYNQLSTLNANTFSSFGNFLQAKLGKGYFKSWTDMSRLLGNIEIPTQAYASATTSSSPVLSSTTINTLNAITGTGSGPFNNPIISDYLGGAAGIPYTEYFTTLNTNYSTVLTSQVSTAVNNLNQAVIRYDAILQANVYPPDITTVDSNVALLNSALNSLSVTPTLTNSQTAYYTMLNKLTIEVANLNSIGVVFNSGTTQMLRSLAQQIAILATDKTQYQTYQFFANVISNDAYGDAIRAAIAESINLNLLTRSGITTSNDPNPTNAVIQAQSQNIPLTTYLSQNK